MTQLKPRQEAALVTCVEIFHPSQNFADEPDGGARHCGDAGCGDTRHHVPAADGAGGPATGLLQQSAGVPAPPPPAGPALRTAEEEVRGRARKAD